MLPTFRSGRLVIPCLLSLVAGVSQAQETNVEWSGFQNGGHHQVDGPLPSVWSPGSPTIAWQAELTGYGQSTPVCGDGKIFVTSTSGERKQKFHLAALDPDSGARVWQVDFDNPTPENNDAYISRAAPTPAIDSAGVYVLNEGGVLAGLDFDGAIRWRRDLVVDHGPIAARHGLAASLEQDADRLFVSIERSDEPYLLAVEKSTGKTLWRVAGLGATTWGSPRLIPVDGSAQLVCSGSGLLAGFDPASGERLWTLNEVANNSSSTPIPAGAGRFFIGVSDGRGEAASDGSATASGLVEIRAANGGYQAEFLWRADRARCSFGSPLVTADSVWVVNRTGALFRLDLETGEQRSVTRLQAGSVWATPLQVGNQLYCFGQQGVTSIVSLDDASEVATNRLWGESAAAANAAPGSTGAVQYAAAVFDRILLIRQGDRLSALR